MLNALLTFTTIVLLNGVVGSYIPSEGLRFLAGFFLGFFLFRPISQFYYRLFN